MKKHQKNIINGWLNINKPVGVTSNDVLFWLKKILSPAKIGHAGTLDPFACGVLQVAMGEATKTIEYAQERQKTYIFTLKFGHETTTEDIEGEPTITSNKIPSEVELVNILPSFLGKISQVPPKFSAVKINGKRAYDLARNNQEFEIKAKFVQIYSLKLIKTLSKGEFLLEVLCGKGTYVRSLGRDIARKLGSAAHLTTLQRTKVGGFAIEDAIILQNKEESLQMPQECFISQLKSVDAVLDDIPVLHLGFEDCARLKNGVQINLKEPVNIGLVRVYDGQKFMAIANNIQTPNNANSVLKPVKIIH
jgi:tRNA pseudouridine55 synthase